MNIIGDYFILDNGTTYCSNNKMKLTFYLNGQQVLSINNYVVKNGDELIVLYGNDSLPKISTDLSCLIRQLNHYSLSRIFQIPLDKILWIS